jgi:hypothetical protein
MTGESSKKGCAGEHGLGVNGGGWDGVAGGLRGGDHGGERGLDLLGAGGDVEGAQGVA